MLNFRLEISPDIPSEISPTIPKYNILQILFDISRFSFRNSSTEISKFQQEFLHELPNNFSRNSQKKNIQEFSKNSFRDYHDIPFEISKEFLLEHNISLRTSLENPLWIDY